MGSKSGHGYPIGGIMKQFVEICRKKLIIRLNFTSQSEFSFSGWELA